MSSSSRTKKTDSSSGLRQITLFDSPASRPAPETLRRSTAHSFPSSSPSKKKIEMLQSEDSSDEIAAITFAPIEKVASRNVSSRDSSPVLNSSHKGRMRRMVAVSPDESEKEPPPQAKLSHDSSSHRSNDSDDSEPPRKKRRLRRQKRSEIVVSSEEDVSLLADEVEEERILDTRLRTREKSKFQKNLEKLRKRKSKLPEEESESEGDTEHHSEEFAHSLRRFRGSKPSSEHQDDDEDSDDEEVASANSSDFIVEDDDAVELPPEFSMETHQDLSHQFKKIYQFFVHIAVQPPKKRAAYMQMQMQKEQYFSVPLQVTRRKLSGLRDSLVASSVWKPDFRSNLEKYPEFELIRLDYAVPSCDACHLGGRLSTLMGRLNGTTYNPCGFEPKRVRNEDEQKGKEFHLGRFCAKRTRVFHEFSHWEYDLFQGILQEINQLRASLSSTDFHHVAYAGGKPPADLEDADALCDWLDKRKMIDMEWQKMKYMMESARHLEMEKEDTAN